MKITETLQLVLALLGSLTLMILWAGKKLIFVVFILGLVLPLIPKETESLTTPTA